MKKIVLFFLLLSISKAYSQQKINWAEVLYGDIKSLKENKIKTLKLKNGNKVLRSVEVISGNSIVVKDSLNEVNFEFDNENRLLSVMSINDKKKESFRLDFRNIFVNGVSRLVDKNELEVYNHLSKVYFNNSSYEEKEAYSFDKKKNDSLNVVRIKYFFNKQNPDLGYKETYEDRKVWSKKYFNQTEVKKEVFADYYTIDSLLKKDDIVTKFHFENHPDHQNIKIENDSVLTIQKKLGKKVSEKLEYASVPFREIFYDENEHVKEKIIYQNYKNPFNEWILWEERKYDGKGKLISQKHPNKKEYKLKNGVLVYRKNVHRIGVTSCGIWCKSKKAEFYYTQIYSPSVLFEMNFSNRFTQHFDTSSIFESDEMIYIYINFQNDAKIISEYSSSEEVRKEGIRTSKSVRRFLDKYFKDLTAEAETFGGKKYIINLSENIKLLNFPIHTFLIKDEN